MSLVSRYFDKMDGKQRLFALTLVLALIAVRNVLSNFDIHQRMYNDDRAGSTL